MMSARVVLHLSLFFSLGLGKFPSVQDPESKIAPLTEAARGICFFLAIGMDSISLIRMLKISRI